MTAPRCLPFVLLLAGACATGGKDNGQPVDASTGKDAGVVDGPRTDAPTTPIDAPVTMPDAFVMPDAGTGLFCTANNQCTVSGECCVTLGGPMGFCAPGTAIGSTCIPIN